MYVKNDILVICPILTTFHLLVNFEGAKHYIYDYYSVDKYIHKINGDSDLFRKKWQIFDGLMEI